MQSMGRSMHWTLEDNMVYGLFCCPTLRPHRRPYPICTNMSGKVRHRCGGGEAGPRLFLRRSFRVVGAGVGYENAESCGVVRPLRIPSRMLLLSDELMRCCRAGTNGCLDLRRRVFALNRQVSDEWSKCPGSMARRTRDSVVPLRRSSAGWMPARIGRFSAGAGCRHQVTIHKASLMAGAIRRV